jgi:hypothetical protein
MRYPSLTVSPFLNHLLQLLQDGDSRVVGGLVILLLLMALLVGFIFHLRRPSPEEIERRRRERLAISGRITDGVITDARSFDGEDSTSPTPDVLYYSYRLAGVTYNCAQDVSRLPDLVFGFRIDQPAQVRYDPRNPGNSILVSESWSGLWQK